MRSENLKLLYPHRVPLTSVCIHVFTYISVYITYKCAHIVFYTDGNFIICLYTSYIYKYV